MPSTERSSSDVEFERRSSAMRRALAEADRLAEGDDGIVLVGEPGCGRERLARYLHSRSARAGARLAVVDCANLGGDAAAHLAKLIASADRGGVLLRGVEGLSTAIRSSLAHALRSRAPSRSFRTPIGVRLFVAAAVGGDGLPLADLATGILAHGLGVPLRVPALRERRPDIPGVVERLLLELAQELGGGRRRVTSAALDAIEAYLWPGNVQELRDVLRRAHVVAGDGLGIEVEHLPRFVRVAVETHPDVDETLATVERTHIVAILTRHGGHRGATAQALGISERTLLRRLADYGLARHRG